MAPRFATDSSNAGPNQPVSICDRTSVQQSNRLRAVLLRYYPAALDIFNGLDVQIALEFIRAYPSPQEAAKVSCQEFQTFATAQRYSNRNRLPACYARLQRSYQSRQQRRSKFTKMKPCYLPRCYSIVSVRRMRPNECQRHW